MWFTALLPPPPTPITLIIEDCSFGISNSIFLSISISFFFLQVSVLIHFSRYLLQTSFFLFQEVYQKSLLLFFLNEFLQRIPLFYTFQLLQILLKPDQFQ